MYAHLPPTSVTGLLRADVSEDLGTIQPHLLRQDKLDELLS